MQRRDTPVRWAADRGLPRKTATAAVNSLCSRPGCPAAIWENCTYDAISETRRRTGVPRERIAARQCRQGAQDRLAQVPRCLRADAVSLPRSNNLQREEKRTSIFQPNGEMQLADHAASDTPRLAEPRTTF